MDKWKTPAAHPSLGTVWNPLGITTLQTSGGNNIILTRRDPNVLGEAMINLLQRVFALGFR